MDARSHRRRLDRQFDAVRAMPDPLPEGERHRSGVDRVGPGGYLRAGDRAYRVEGVSEYREGRERWTELELLDLFTGDTSALEWERDDELEICLNNRELELADLGLAYSQVESMADAERGVIRLDGRSYRYDDDYRCTYHRGGSGEGESLFVVEFETRDEEHCLAVEAWGERGEEPEIQVWLGHYLEPDEVEVLVTGGADGA